MPRLLLAVALACAGIFCLSQSDVDAACVGSRRVVCLAAPKAAPYMIAGNRLQINQGKAQVALAAEQYFLSRFYVGSANWTAKNCRFLLSNSYSAAGVITNPGNGVNIEKMALWLGGSFVAPITVSGSRSITLADGQYLWTDPVAVSIAPNSQVELRIAGNVTSLNQYLVGGGYRVQTVNAERFATATTTLSGSVDSGTLVAGDGSFGANGFIFNAMACQGWDGTSPVALVLGDSIGWGNLENQNLADARGNYGYVAIGLDSATNGRISMWNTTMFSANMNVVKTNTISGTIVLTLENSSTNMWLMECIAHEYQSPTTTWGSDRKALAGALERFQLLSTNGYTFDLGEFNYIVEY